MATFIISGCAKQLASVYYLPKQEVNSEQIIAVFCHNYSFDLTYEKHKNDFRLHDLVCLETKIIQGEVT